MLTCFPLIPPDILPALGRDRVRRPAGVAAEDPGLAQAVAPDARGDPAAALPDPHPAVHEQEPGVVHVSRCARLCGQRPVRRHRGAGAPRETHVRPRGGHPARREFFAQPPVGLWRDPARERNGHDSDGAKSCTAQRPSVCQPASQHLYIADRYVLLLDFSA